MKIFFYPYLTSLVIGLVFSHSIAHAQQIPATPSSSSTAVGKNIDTSPGPSLDGYKSFEETKPAVATPDSTPLDKPREIPGIPVSNTGAEKKSPPPPSEISLPLLPETEGPELPGQIEPSPEESDIFATLLKLKKAIAGADISEAGSLLERYRQIINKGPEDSHDKEFIQNVMIFLNELSYVDMLIKQGDLKNASIVLRKTEKKFNLPEMRRGIKVMVGQINSDRKLRSDTVKLHGIYLKGVKSLKDRRWLEAISFFTKIHKTDPDYLQVKENLNKARTGNYMREGARLVERKRFPEARSMYQSVLEIDPLNPEATLEISLLPEKKTEEIPLSEKQTPGEVQINRPKATEEVKTAGLDSNNSQAKSGIPGTVPLSKTEKILNRFSQYKKYSSHYYRLLRPLAVEVAVVLLVLVLVFRFGKIRRYYQKIKKLNANRLLYEDILENSPDRRALYPSVASIYRQLKMSSKLSWLQEMCNEQLHNASADEAPLWQLCLGEINQEYGNLDVALRETEQAWHMDPNREEIRQKLERLYLIFLERDPENPVWKTGLANICTPQTPPPVQPADRGGKVSSGVNKAKTHQPPTGGEVSSSISQQKQTLAEVFGREKHSGPSTTTHPPHLDAEPESGSTKTDIFSQEQKRDAYEEIFGRRKKETEEEEKLKA